MTKRIATILFLCAGSLWLLHGEAARQLPFPRVSDGSLLAWFVAASPVTAAMTALRAVAVMLTWYLLAVVALQILAALAGRQWRLVDAITPTLIKQAIGVSLSIGAVIPAWTIPAGAQANESPPVTMVRVGEETGTTPVEVPPAESTRTSPNDNEASYEDKPDAMVMTRLGPIESEAAATTFATTWVVTEGEHFWQIATDVLEDRLDRAPTEREVDSYWRLLIERNEHRLIDPANPDLILPGQVLDLPATA